MRLVRYSYPRFLQRSPWSGLESEINRVFQAAVADVSGVPSNRFPVDLYEDKANAYVRAELPGVNRDDINVELVDGYLKITATRKAAPATGSGPGEESTSFSRSISVVEDVQADQVAAAYENGVLTVTLPKREESKPKKITVAVK